MMTNDRLATTIGATPQTLPPLPFSDTALAPVITAETLGFHYGKPHRTYVETLAGAEAVPLDALYGMLGVLGIKKKK